MKMVIEDSAMNHLADRGYDPAFGARPVKRVVQQELETALAKGILRGDFGDGDTVIVSASDNHLIISRDGDPSHSVVQEDNPAELSV